jgi:hypothetical protein
MCTTTARTLFQSTSPYLARRVGSSAEAFEPIDGRRASAGQMTVPSGTRLYRSGRQPRYDRRRTVRRRPCPLTGLSRHF